ncbi:hypothetical protein BWQ96_03548 [Gracilariopsis chorda]|uniref:Phospholipid/glycerol acyltransferase domain-containing protein n=1 Tax=Gracilariopsis chorda TaxID=448386 RepID=A0A2V3IX55_9FLOR|nr:hypothetical protein BWQ96_03548 [Gracilariopsis chorda]|eukprot:PXF46722.1 hypothetical protein BWQ96_03548 [Gracilariopsis chorda]
MTLVNKLSQLAFALAFLNCLLVTWMLTMMVHVVPFLGSRRQRESYSIAISSLMFRYLMVKPCPWIRVRGVNELYESLAEAGKERAAPYIIANHNSKLDSLLITALLPTWLGPRLRSLIKKALFDEPLFGGICERVGHFAVYYKGAKEGEFGVNKEAQASVARAMDEFVANDGGLLIFPEGQLNRNSRKVQTLRRGAFSLPIKHGKAIWAFLNVGCERCWPTNSAIGGIPANIYVKLIKVTDDASAFDTIALAEHAQQVMQRELDKMYAVCDGELKQA